MKKALVLPYSINSKGFALGFPWKLNMLINVQVNLEPTFCDT